MQKTPNLMKVQGYSDVLRHHTGSGDSVWFHDMRIACLKTYE
jgi:hypothetical protein